MLAFTIISCILGSLFALGIIGSVVDSFDGGCIIWPLGLNGYIGGNYLLGMYFGKPDLAIGNLIFIILGIIFVIIKSWGKDNLSSSERVSGERDHAHAVMDNWRESRKNEPHTCVNCAN